MACRFPCLCLSVFFALWPPAPQFIYVLCVQPVWSSRGVLHYRFLLRFDCWLPFACLLLNAPLGNLPCFEGMLDAFLRFEGSGLALSLHLPAGFLVSVCLFSSLCGRHLHTVKKWYSACAVCAVGLFVSELMGIQVIFISTSLLCWRSWWSCGSQVSKTFLFYSCSCQHQHCKYIYIYIYTHTHINNYFRWKTFIIHSRPGRPLFSVCPIAEIRQASMHSTVQDDII